MNSEKVNILFNFKKGPWGGGNQFLKALREEFKKKKVYTHNPKNAGIILFNSHHNLINVLKLKFKYPEKIFAHRIDGPIFFIRNKNLEIDKLIFEISNKIADLSIFQSQWSFEKCKQLGFKENNAHTIIYNAPNNLIFNKNHKQPFKQSGKIRLIATSWSDNFKKGFNTYKYLDTHLNYNKYEFVFIGNTPVQFKNIIHIPPLSSENLSTELKKADIFITASQNDPCSNSLIEALSCGLPAVVLNDGGHPELIKNGGEIFNTNKEALEKINMISKNYTLYKKNIPQYNIAKIAKKYYNNFISKKHSNKKISIFTFIFLYLKIKTTNLISILK